MKGTVLHIPGLDLLAGSIFNFGESSELGVDNR